MIERIRVSQRQTERLWLILVILVGLILGVVLADDFGKGWDEHLDYTYAQDALRAYQGETDHLEYRNRMFYGPFHMELSYLAGKLVKPLGGPQAEIAGRHFFNYVVFLLAGVGIYYLASRLMTLPYARITTIFFLSQPLLFGHAFVNHKDAAFMSYFVLSVALGLLISDRAGQSSSRLGGSRSRSDGEDEAHSGRLTFIWAKWRAMLVWERVVLLFVVALILLASLDLVFGWFFLPAGQRSIERAYEGSAMPLLQQVFDKLAEDAYKTPLRLYVDQFHNVYLWMRGAILGLLALVFLGLIRWRLAYVWKAVTVFRLSDVLLFIVAGAVLGVTSSIRVAGPLAGVLVSIYMVLEHRRRSIVPLLAYWSAAGLTMYLTWPILWESPIDQFLVIFEFMSSFPRHYVLYFGDLLRSHSLPWHYLPALSALQLTEPTLPLFAIGVASGVRISVRDRKIRTEVAILALWFLVPASAIVVFGRPIYDNIRHMLFGLPPVLLLAGLGVKPVVEKIGSRRWRRILCFALLVPGVVGIVVSHPYEYSYFNSYIGGMSGAYESFQLDPWCTSLRAAMEYVNRAAPENSEIAVRGPAHAAQVYAREDLNVIGIEGERLPHDYVLICRVPTEGHLYEKYPVVFEVRKGNAVLTQVKERP